MDTSLMILIAAMYIAPLLGIAIRFDGIDRKMEEIKKQLEKIKKSEGGMAEKISKQEKERQKYSI